MQFFGVYKMPEFQTLYAKSVIRDHCPYILYLKLLVNQWKKKNTLSNEDCSNKVILHLVLSFVLFYTTSYPSVLIL